MNKAILILLTIMSVCKSKAQTYDEWFRQNKTQKKYLLQQIAALQTYIGYAEKGFSIVTSGLNTIQDIKKGDFNLHSKFFTSLMNVNPEVKKYVKVAQIISMQISIAKVVNNTIKDCRNARQMTDAEMNYLQHVFNNLLDDCGKDLDELFGLITDGQQQMKDDERIKRIDKLYADMQDKKMFTQSFSNSAKGLSVQRRNDAYDIQIERKLNGL